MKFDKHNIYCNIRCKSGLVGGAHSIDGKIGPLWEKMKEMADSEIVGWTFWVTLRRGPIEVQAHGDSAYADVERRAERILIAAETVHKREHAAIAKAAAGGAV